MLLLSPIVMALLSPAGHALPADHPSPSELLHRYERSGEIATAYRRLTYNRYLEPHWVGEHGDFWYLSSVRGHKEFVFVEPEKGLKRAAFDHARLAESLSKAEDKTFGAYALPFESIAFDDKREHLRFEHADKAWECSLATYTLTSKPAEKKAEPAPEPWGQNLWPPDPNPQRSPDQAFVAQIVDWNVNLAAGKAAPRPLTTDGSERSYYARVIWSPDSRRMVAIRVTAGDRKKVYLVQNSPEDWGPAVLKEHVYDRPGDKVDSFTLSLFDPATGKPIPVDVEPIDYGDMSEIRWRKDGRHFIYEKMDRGYGRYRIIEVDSETGRSRTLIEERPSTFVDSTSQYVYYCRESDEMIYRSERDGFGRLYHSTADGALTPITPKTWVVREVVDVDEKTKRIVFGASGANGGEDPYFVHYYGVDFDGSNLVSLTPDKGNHTAAFSPEKRWLVDSCSQVDVPPLHALRNAKGEKVMDLEVCDVADLNASGFVLPQPFVAKGRDGKTDIYGVVYRPSYFDPSKSYPILEDIYAGPQDSFVPKSYGEMGSDHAMAELGFIVVKIDGMGTRNRGKAFQDVCYKNLADAGLPDRILWMKALHAKLASADIERVGVFGTSAGGQSAAGAVLFHPEFYKAAVAACGCHDNRLDKIWWNEQWMATLGPHYAEQSNIANAYRLKGALLLIVGELDTNVPPESTYRFAAALQAANKDFELVVIPNSDHTSGGPYGEHKRRDFFVRKLIGVEPPKWNP